MSECKRFENFIVKQVKSKCPIIQQSPGDPRLDHNFNWLHTGQVEYQNV